MSCALTSGRTTPCKDTAGGIKKILALNFIENAFTITAGEATALNVGVTTVFEYPLRSSENTFNQELVSDKNTGTTVNTQTLTVRLIKQDHATSSQIKLMAHTRPIFVVVGYDGTYKVAGHTEGMDLTASNIQSGNARSDFNGYDLTFTAEELVLAPHLSSGMVTAVNAIISATNITA